MVRGWLAALMVGMVLTGCGQADDNEDAGPPPATPSETASQEDDMTDESAPAEQAIADLAKQTGADPATIEVVSDESVTWRDGSLGCPEPGKMYTQALVEGYRIVLRTADSEAVYHGATGRPPFRCDHPNPNGAIG